MRALCLSLVAVMLSTMPASAMSDGDLRAALEQRFKDDRTGACVAAAVIDDGTTARAYFCADAKSQRPYDEHTAFEIGSVTKTMTAALLAEFIARGEVTLDDPIAKLLPPGTSVPSFNGRQITIGDIVTHTSGLPSFPWRMTDINNPYARLTERDLLGTLAATQLTRAPGVAVGVFEFRDDGAVLRARQAQRQGLRDAAARTSARSARHERNLHRQAPAAGSSRPRPPRQRPARRALGFSCRHGRRRRRARHVARHGALPRRRAWHARERDHAGVGADARAGRQCRRPHDGHELDAVHRERSHDRRA